MRGKLETSPYKGVRDFYPKDWTTLSAVFSTIRNTLRLWGYEEYQASPLEHSELYESKGNEEIIREQTFSFEDRGGRRVTLRPEMTPTLARMVSRKRRELVFPLRWFSIGNRFRYERPQRGRLREFFQVDVDIIGLSEGEADLEAVMLVCEVLKAFGATKDDFVIRINSRSLLSAACRATGYTDEEGVREYWRLLDKKAKMNHEGFSKAIENHRDPLTAIEEATDKEVRTEKEKLRVILETLHTRNVTNVVFDPEIVRGFDYYTGMVFEVFDMNPVNPRALFGGGRYDGLVTVFGGDPIPAIGFAIGDVTLLDFLETHGYLPNVLSAPMVYIGTPQISDITNAQAFAEELRKEYISVVVHLAGKSLGDQVKEANRRSIPFFIAFGEHEALRKTVLVKKLSTGEEETVPRAKVPEFLSSRD